MNIKNLSAKLSISSLVMAFAFQANANTDWNGGTGDWNTGANWSNGTPGFVDDNAYFNNEGTINVTAVPATVTPSSNFYQARSGTVTGDTTLIWNPGASLTTFNQFWISDNSTASVSVMDHRSGTIRANNSWYHIGRRGDGTYKMSGSSVVQAVDRLSIAEGAGGGLSNNFVFEMRDNSVVDGQFAGASNNDYFLAHEGNARGQLLMYNNSLFDVPRLEVARENTAQGTVTQNQNSRIQIEFDVDRFAYTGDNKAWWTMNNSSTAEIGTQFRPARFGNAEATLSLNGTASFQAREFGGSLEQNQNTSTTVVMNDFSTMTVNSWMELGGGQATMTMNDQSYLDANGRLAVGMRSSTGAPGDGISRLTLNDNSTVDARGDILWAGLETGSKGLITVNGTANLISDNAAIGRQGQGTVVINGGSWENTNWMSIGQESGGTVGEGTLTINGGIVSANGNLEVGERTAGNLNVNGGVLQVANGMRIARDQRNINDATNDSVVNQSAGDIFVRGTLHMGGLDSITHGTHAYNLDGGTLHVNDLNMGNAANIAAGGSTTFNWGNGTLTTRAVNENSTGNGSLITITGDITTGYAGDGSGGNAASTLDLGDLYKDGGTKYDHMLVNGALNLTSTNDILDFWTNVQHLRLGGNTITTGEIRLVGASSVSGIFENIIGPGAGGTFFRTWTPAEVATLGITGVGDLTRNRGAVIYKADGVYFAYNISGQIPEPATGMFLLFGTMMLRGVSAFRRNQRTRRRLNVIG
ncbi:MAG: hypothetical protein ACI97B_001736 [Verrucomicrobiales bacterium]|jgi:hypothetical protein